jgi:autotransporter-associated beta strand protein
MKSIPAAFLCFIALLLTPLAEAQQLAFPGAQGFGRHAVGGRYGSVYKVTNLNDSGTGSLRDAVSQPNRIVIFDVAGVIRLNSRMVFAKNLYVAGQTAPGEGVIVYGDGVSFSGATNTIVRYMRFRMGKQGTSGADAAGVANGTNMIFDHVSVAWGQDETFSISPDGKGDLGNITIQNSLIGQGLLSHSAGGLVQADSITLYRNVYVDNSTRNAKIKGRNQYVNNLVYNWKNAAYIMGGESTGHAYCNAVSNLFIKGPAGGGSPFSGGNELFHLYAADNWYDSDLNGQLNPSLLPQSAYSGPPDFQSVPYPYPTLPTWSATVVADSLLPNVGASLPYRDNADHYMISEIESMGKEGKLIADEALLPIGAPSSWTVWSGVTRTDSDGDGIPDAWETANGTNPALNDAMVLASNGYANIENYINSLSKADRQFFLRAPVGFSLAVSTQSTLSLQWFDYTEDETGFMVEVKENGVFKEIARVPAGAQTATLDSLLPATAYTLRAKAYNEAGQSAYTPEITVKTQPEEVPVIDPETFVPDLTWAVESATWDATALLFNNETAAFTPNAKVLFEPLSDITVTVNETLTPGDVVVRDEGNVTLTGTGSLAGTGSLNKGGAGTLTVQTANTYTGATVLSGGTYAFSTLKDGGVASGLGASQEFAQNWIWKGGTWLYTGSTTTTNRSAKVYADTELKLANSGTTVTLNGRLEGQGSLILNGQGTLNNKQPLGTDGPLVLRGGTYYVEGSALIDSGLGRSPKLVLAGGTYKTKDADDRYGIYRFPIEVEEGTYSTFWVHRNCSINNTISGAGTLEMPTSWLREYIKGDWTGFTGTVVANGIGSSSQFMLNNGTGIPNGVVYAKGNVQVISWATTATMRLGGLSGDAGTFLSGTSKNTTSAKMTWMVGGANTDETFRGVIDNRCSASGYNGTTSIVKEGDGSWRLTGTNVYKGTTQVNNGTLIVNGAHTGTGAITVAEGATLAGVGSLTGPVTLVGEAYLKAGDTLVNNLGLTFKGGLTLSDRSVTFVPLQKTSPTSRKANKLTILGKATLGGTLRLLLDGITYPLQKGNYFDILGLTGATVSGTFANVVPETPGEGLIWDLSQLYSTGRLYVREEGYVGLNNSINGAHHFISTLANNTLTINLPGSMPHATLSIIDLTGRKQLTCEVTTHGTVDVSCLSKGIYLTQLACNGQTVTERLVKN